MKSPLALCTCFFLVTLTMICGLGLAMIHGFMVNPDIDPLNSTDLHTLYQIQANYVIPHMQELFPLLAGFNFGVAIIILMFPITWIWVVRFSHNILTPASVPMKGTVFFLILAVGHNTFFECYSAYKSVPASIFLTMFYPHAFLEILAFILAGTYSLVCIDAVRDYCAIHDDMQNLNPGELSIFVLQQVWYILIVLGMMIIIAAAIECFITPRMVCSVIESYVQGQ